MRTSFKMNLFSRIIEIYPTVGRTKNEYVTNLLKININLFGISFAQSDAQICKVFLKQVDSNSLYKSKFNIIQ